MGTKQARRNHVEKDGSQTIEAVRLFSAKMQEHNLWARYQQQLLEKERGTLDESSFRKKWTAYQQERERRFNQVLPPPIGMGFGGFPPFLPIIFSNSYEIAGPPTIDAAIGGFRQAPDQTCWIYWSNTAGVLWVRWDFIIPNFDFENIWLTGGFEVHSRLTCEGGLADTQEGGHVMVSPLIQTELWSDAEPRTCMGSWFSTEIVPHQQSYIDSTEGIHVFTQPFDINCAVTGNGAKSGQLIRVYQKILFRLADSYVQFQYEDRGTIFTPQPVVVLRERLGRVHFDLQRVPGMWLKSK